MNLRRLRAVARKEFLHILRDPRSLGMALALPLVMLLLFGYALSLDVDRIPTAIYDRDRTPASRELASKFAGSRYFEIVAYAEAYGEIERGINKDSVLLAVVIPAGFGADVAAGRQAHVQLLVDGSDSNTASIGLGYAETLIQLHAAELRIAFQDRKAGMKLESAVDPRIRVLYNSDLKSRNYIVPGLIAVIMMIIAALLTSLTIAREWEMGTMEQLLSTPLRPAELLLGKLAAFFALGIVDMIVAVGAGLLLFQVPFRGSVALLASSACVFLFGALCWGILLSTIARSQLLAYQMGMLSSFLPAFLLSGFVYAIETMPAIVQAISHVFPARYFITIVKGVFLKGVGLSVVWVEFALLGLYALAVFAIAVRKLGNKVA